MLSEVLRRNGGIEILFADGSVAATTIDQVAAHRVAIYERLDPGLGAPHHAAETRLFFAADYVEVIDWTLQYLGARMCTPAEAAEIVHRWPTAAEIATADADGLPWVALAQTAGGHTRLGVAVLGIREATRPRVVKRPSLATQKRVALIPTHQPKP